MRILITNIILPILARSSMLLCSLIYNGFSSVTNY
uniref:Uncharacterized protein n=1 Tax=Arundo donax TaxID=35708 RepID=A0A0A9F4R3_ARUDO